MIYWYIYTTEVYTTPVYNNGFLLILSTPRARDITHSQTTDQLSYCSLPSWIAVIFS